MAAAVAKQGWPETCLDGIVDYSWQQEYMRFMFILMDTNGKYNENAPMLMHLWRGAF